MDFKPKAQISIERQELVRLLEEALLNAPYVDMIYDSSKATIANVTSNGYDFSTDIKEGFKCFEPSKSRYDINSILRVVKVASCDEVILKDNSELLSMQFSIMEGMSLQFLLGSAAAHVVRS